MELARRVPPGGIIVEAGSLYGLASWHISKACHPGVTVFCIAPWERANWSDRIKPGGTVAGHDYCAAWPEVATEADALAARWSSRVELVDTLWSVRRPV